MKKFITLGMTLCAIFLVIGCSSKPSNKTNYYDDKYIQTLANALDKRWQYSDSDAAKKDSPIDRLTKATNIELDLLKKGNFSEKNSKIAN